MAMTMLSRIDRVCAVHILRNVRTARGTETGFHDNMFWRLQGSESADEYARHLAAFASVFPNTMKYLEGIEPARWVRYAQLEAGAHTFGWRSNNAGEIAQGSWLGTMRAMHPLDFFVNVHRSRRTKRSIPPRWSIRRGARNRRQTRPF